MATRDWCVMRQDDHGNRYVVVTALTEAEAALLATSYAARGHKQLYWIAPMATPSTVTGPLPATLP